MSKINSLYLIRRSKRRRQMTLFLLAGIVLLFNFLTVSTSAQTTGDKQPPQVSVRLVSFTVKQDKMPKLLAAGWDSLPVSSDLNFSAEKVAQVEVNGTDFEQMLKSAVKKKFITINDSYSTTGNYNTLIEYSTGKYAAVVDENYFQQKDAQKDAEKLKTELVNGYELKISANFPDLSELTPQSTVQALLKYSESRPATADGGYRRHSIETVYRIGLNKVALFGGWTTGTDFTYIAVILSHLDPAVQPAQTAAQ